MKKKLLILTLLPLIFSCQKRKMDWAQINLPIPLDSIAKNYEILPLHAYDSNKLKLYKSFDKKLLFFDEIPLEGKALVSNSVIFYVSDLDQKIVAITLSTEDEENTDQLLKIIDQKLGKPDYHYCYNENQKLITTQKIWEKEGNFYTLNAKDPDYLLGKKTRTAQFTIFNAENNIFLRWWFYDGGDFSGFYGQYLDERKITGHKNRSYTYKDFVEQMDRENRNNGTTSKYFIK